ncbi:hypothetical protein ACLBXM_06545 [Xanthobacteraceae bacterium A53D]
MTVICHDTHVGLEGACRVEDAEPLTALLQREPRPIVDLSSCTAIHSAIVQVLLAFRPELRGAPADAFIRDMLLPALAMCPPAEARTTDAPARATEE